MRPIALLFLSGALIAAAPDAGPDPALLDDDGDGLSNAEEAAAGTDPREADTDGDALPDGWELHGHGGVDLKAKGADPRHKDVFVEMGYMVSKAATNGLRADAATIARIVQAFREIPSDNPDGRPGIELHLEWGKEIPYQKDLSPYLSTFQDLRKTYFDAKSKQAIYHYMIWANAYDGGTSSGVSMNIPSTGFLVTLGSWNRDAGGTEEQKIGTFMHELGHNLGLHHGGQDELNYKPNYFSVMNYLWQTSGVARAGVGRFEYQRAALGALEEGALNEKSGLNTSASLTGYQTVWICPDGASRMSDAVGPVDWNCRAPANEARVRADINGDHRFARLESPADLTALDFEAGVIGRSGMGLLEVSGLEKELPSAELNERSNELIQQLLRHK